MTATAASADASAAKPDLGAYDDTTRVSYWQRRWDVSAVGWRAPERSASGDGYSRFAADCASFFRLPAAFSGLARGAPKPADSEPATGSTDAASATGRLPLPLRNVHVFVPLCGDTPGLGFFLLAGATVTGLDASEIALRKAMEEMSRVVADAAASGRWAPNVAAGVAAPRVELKWTTAALDEGTTVFSGRIVVVVAEEGEAGESDSARAAVSSPADVTLVCGDFFTAALPAPGTVDFVYDRASAVAMLPSHRERYFARIRSLLRNRRRESSSSSSAAAVAADDGHAAPVGAVVRFIRRTEAARADGPPFALDPDELRHAYFPSAPDRAGSDIAAAAAAAFDVDVVYEPTQAELTPFGEGVALVYMR
jgi:hypothetical protein